MKKYIPYIIVLVVGIVIGLLCRPNHYTDRIVTQIDTLYEAKYYSRLELAGNTYKLDIPKIAMADFVYIKSDSTKIVYKDSIQYIALPREYYYTSMDDVEIWHSGIDSTIDSLNVMRKTTTITKTETISTIKKNALALGLEFNYTTSPYIPIYLEYSHLLHKNVEMSAKILYDIPTQSVGFGLGAKVRVGW